MPSSLESNKFRLMIHISKFNLTKRVRLLLDLRGEMLSGITEQNMENERLKVLKAKYEGQIAMLMAILKRKKEELLNLSITFKELEKEFEKKEVKTDNSEQ